MDTRTGASVGEVQKGLFEAARALIAWQYRVDAFAEDQDEVALIGEAARLAGVVEGAVESAARTTRRLLEEGRERTASSRDRRG